MGGKVPGTSGRRRAEPGAGRHRTGWHSAPIGARTQCRASVRGAAELSLRQSREPRQRHEWAEEGQAPRGRADAPLVPHKGQKGVSPEWQSCRSAGAAQRGGKGQAPKGRAVAQPVPHEGQQKGQAPGGRAVAQPVPHKGQQKGQAPKGRAVAQPVPHEGQQKGQAPKGRAVAQPVLHKGQQKGQAPSGSAVAPPRGRRSRMSGSRARRVRHAPAHQRQYGRMLCGRGGPATRGLRGPSTPCHRIAVSEVA